MNMLNPAHPGQIIRECMGDQITVAALAAHLQTPRVNLSNIIHGKRDLSAAMALKLGQAFPKQPAEFWMRLQAQYDLAQERGKKPQSIAPLPMPVAA